MALTFENPDEYTLPILVRNADHFGSYNPLLRSIILDLGKKMGLLGEVEKEKEDGRPRD